MMHKPRSEALAESDPAARGLTIQSGAPLRDGYHYGEMGGRLFEGPSVDLRKFLRILNRRKWLIVAVAVCMGSLALLRALLQEPLYASTVRLQLNRGISSLGKNGGFQLIEFDDSWFDTEVELLQSRDLAERVASLTRFRADETPSARGAAESGGGASDQERAADMILGGIAVKALKPTHLVDITYTDRDPVRAQRIARAYGEASLAVNRDRRLEANADAKAMLEDQIRELKHRLEDADKAVLAFAEQRRIVSTTDKVSVAESNLSAASTALSGLVAERIRNGELWRQVEDESKDLPQILANKAVEELRSQRRQLLAEYQEKSETFRADYPTMAQLRNKIQEIDRQLVSEVKTVRASLKAAYEASLHQENEMRQRVEKLRGEMLELQRHGIEYNILKHDADATRSLYDSLLERYKELDINGGGANRVFVVGKARLPHAPMRPDRLKWFLVGLALGLGVGVALALAMEHTDDRVHLPLDAEQASGLPLLGIIPRPGRKQTFESAAENAASAVSDAFRSVCLLLRFSTEYGVPKTLMVTSANPAEGKSSTSLGIARAFSAMGLKVLVVDADLRKPSLHAKTGLDNSVGLTTYLTRNCAAKEAIRHSERDNLFIMTSGPTPPNPVELLNGARFASLLSGSGEVFDLVLIDAPPVIGPAETLLLSNAVTATVLIIAAGETRIGQVHNAVKLLQQARGTALGAVLTKFDDAPGYGYSYGYGYGYGYQDADGAGEAGDRLDSPPGGPGEPDKPAPHLEYS